MDEGKAREYLQEMIDRCGRTIVDAEQPAEDTRYCATGEMRRWKLNRFLASG